MRMQGEVLEQRNHQTMEGDPWSFLYYLMIIEQGP